MDVAARRTLGWAALSLAMFMGMTPAPAMAFDPSRMRQDGVVAGSRGSEGGTGLDHVDVDGDGTPELVVGSPSAWSIVHHDPATDDYVRRHFIEYADEPSRSPIVAVRLGDLDADGVVEANVLLRGGTLNVHALDTGDLERALVLVDAIDLEIADVDPSPGGEVVLLSADGVSAFAGTDGALLWHADLLDGEVIAVGNLDADPAMEIAVGAENLTRTIDCAMHAIEWTGASVRSQLVDVGDIDADGMDELVGSTWYGLVTAVDVDVDRVKWTLDDDGWAGAIRCLDLDGDGRDEVGIGTLQGSESLHFYDGPSATLLGQVGGLAVGTGAFDVADVDGDCRPEVVWCTGFGNTAPELLTTGDLPSGWFEWRDFGEDARVAALVFGDLDADGLTEVLHAGEHSHGIYDGAIVRVTDWQSRTADGDVTGPVNSTRTTRGLVLIQADADPQLEFVIDSGITAPRLSAFDGISRRPDWTSVTFMGEFVNALTVADPDGDGVDEILMGTGRYSSGTDGVHLRIFSTADGSLLYQSPAALGTASSNEVGHIHVADVDGDGGAEIAMVVAYGGLRVEDGVTHAEEWSLPDRNFLSLDVADVVPGGGLDLVVGTRDGELIGFDGSSHAETFRCALAPGTITAIAVDDLDRDGVDEIVVAQELDGLPSAVLNVLDARDRSVLWTSPMLPEGIAVAGAMEIGDVDDDGKLEIIFGGPSEVRAFEYDDAPLDTRGPLPVVLSARRIPTVSCCPAVQLEWAPSHDDSTPPVSYSVHRGSTASFPIDDTTRLVTTTLHAYRDATAQAATRYWYAIVPSDGRGNEAAVSWAPITTLDPTPPPPPVLLAIDDSSPCEPTGIDLIFSPAAGTPDVALDLEEDGAVVAADVTSPWHHVPPDERARSYRIVARRPECDRRTPGNVAAARDDRTTAIAPLDVRIQDPDPCGASAVVLTFRHDGFPHAGHLELWRDGSPFLAGVRSSDTFSPGDALEHEYVVRAVDDACAATADSAPLRFTDEADCTGRAGEVDLRVRRDDSRSTLVTVTWTPAWGDVVRHDAYAGTLASLRAGVYDHLAAQAGVTFPGAPDESTGCGARDGAARALLVDGLGDAYLLVVAVERGGNAGPFGARSDGIDRHDPAVDLRPPASFCP